MSGEAATVIELAAERGVKIAVAESLTGGLLLSALIDVPGASVAVTGGIVAYDTALKRSLLGVDSDLLIKRGPVDPDVARQMARGVREACATPGPADIGISTTGVAGPDPDPQTAQPAGTVWLGVSSVLGERAVSLRLGSSGERESAQESGPGARARIRIDTVVAALRELESELRRLPGDPRA